MINDILKTILVKGWQYTTYRTLIKKFDLYGPYKKMYEWKNYLYLNEHIELYKLISKKINTEWYKYFTLVRQVEDPAYLPEDIWHIFMEPALNQRSYAKANNDKNFFDNTSFKDLFPNTLLHVIQGVCYDSDFCRISNSKAVMILSRYESYVAKKALDSGGGKGVAFYKSGTNIKIEDLIRSHGTNFIVQEIIEQHPWFEKFNPESVNTVRVVTYRSVKDDNIHVLQTLLRMGKPGSKVDNQSSGGIAVGINNEGVLNSWGCDKLSNRFKHTNGITFAESEPIPDFEKLKTVCINIAKTRLNERVLVFDTARDSDNKIRLMEINNIHIGIEDLQKNNGALFGSFSQEVIEWCSKTKHSYCFDFEL